MSMINIMVSWGEHEQRFITFWLALKRFTLDMILDMRPYFKCAKNKGSVKLWHFRRFIWKFAATYATISTQTLKVG